MVFSSPEFLFVFLPAVLLTYYVVPPVWRNPVLFVFSLFFYGWGEPVYIALMIATIAVDYAGGLLVAHYLPHSRARARAAMVGAIVLNLLSLAFFKYYDFIAEALSALPFVPQLPQLGLTLPVGISFYTFQSLSYVVDVYRGDGRAQKNPVTFGTYVTLFPQLIAGPIVRWCDVDDQLRSREHSVDLFASGVRTFACGLAKKLILANSAGAMWDSLSAGVGNTPSALGAWLGLLFYTFHIYFDFSGYSDMAIGLGKMFGFSFRENFFYPYTADSVTDFWRRWHISLGVWFREYVYIPLGGNRRGRARMLLNLMIVWLLTGLWHGAGWNFVLWGLYYGVLLALEKTILAPLLARVPAAVRRIVTFVLVMFGWLLFAADSVGFIGSYAAAMFSRTLAAPGTLYDLARSVLLLAILAVGSTPLPLRFAHRLYESRRGRAALICATVAAVILSVAYMVASSYNPFLYFRF